MSVRQRDEDLLRALEAEHGPALRSLARRATGDHQLAEDVVQEVLLRAWKHPEAAAEDRGPLRPWLVTVTRRVLIDEHRKRTARPKEVALEAASAPGLSQALAPNAIDLAISRWEIDGALAELSELHREILTEIWLNDRSVAETAAVLGIPAGTVKSRSYYALRALREVLAAKGIQP